MINTIRPTSHIREFSIVISILLLLFLAGCSKISEPAGSSTPANQNLGKGYIRLPNNLGQKYYGFNIFRGEKRDGPFVRANKEIFPAKGKGGDKPFVFIDDQLVVGKEYFYYIEGITFAGRKERVTPPFRAVPKKENE
jgi:hypothetical protein